MIILFILLLLVKQIMFKIRQPEICTICVAVSLTWLMLLFLYWKGYFEDLIFIALLMGQSILGIFYLVERKVAKKYTLFRLPFLLTLLLMAYAILINSINFPAAWVMVALLWILLGALYFYQHNPRINILVNKIVECCKKW